MLTDNNNTITIDNAGTIKHLELPVPETGGIVVARGPNGIGKTTTVDCVAALVRGNGKLPVHDDAAKGTIRGLGRTLNLSVTRSTKHGDLEVVGCQTDFDLADLVSPRFKDTAARERHRIKALVALAGAKPDPALFHRILGGPEEFAAVVPSTSVQAEDVVTLAEQVKRAIDAEALAQEREAERELSLAQGARQAVSGVNIEAADDADALQAELEAAIQAEATLKTQNENAAKARRDAEAAADALEDAKFDMAGPSVETTQKALDEATTAATNADAKVAELEAQLARAKAVAGDARNRVTLATQAHQSAQAQANTLAGWAATIEAAHSAATVDPAALNAARERVTAARQAVEQGALVRRAKESLTKADTHTAASLKAKKRGEQLRAAAKATDDVLSGIVATLGCPLSVHRDALVTPTDRSDREPFDELSDGERWSIALDIVIEKSKQLEAETGKRALLWLNQEAWQGLDWKRRGFIRDKLRGSGVVLFTAEASQVEGDDALHVEVLT